MTTPQYVSRYASGPHTNTFIRAVKSELLKLQRRSLTTTSVTFTVLFVVTPIIFLLTVWKQGIKEPISATSITSGLQLFVLFSIIIGTLAVTSEYASNTMRTSCLAVPQRLKNLLAKCSAVAIYTSGVTAGIIILRFATLGLLSGGRIRITGTDLGTLALFILVTALTALMATGIGYLVRSTAGGISFMVLFIFLLPLVLSMFLRFELFATYAPPLYPMSLLGAIFAPPADASTLARAGYFSCPIALLIFTSYTVGFIALGYARFRKTDI